MEKREIYTAVIVHLYDQATDIAVMIDWGVRTKREVNGIEDYDNVNMLSFFIPGLTFIILYRVITMIFALVQTYENTDLLSIYHDVEDEENKNKRSIRSKIVDFILAIFDLYFIKVIYLEFVAGKERPDKLHRSLQLCEALFERYISPCTYMCF